MIKRRKQYVTRTQLVVYLEVIPTWCFAIRLRYGRAESAKLSVEHSLSLYGTADVCSSSSRQVACEETAVA